MASPKSAAVPQPLAGKRVAVVEDDSIIRVGLEDSLRSAGAIVVASLDQPIDAAILDVNLGSGITVLPIAARLRERLVPFFFLSGESEAYLAPARKSFPTVTIIYKPATSDRIVAEVAALIPGGEGLCVAGSRARVMIADDDETVRDSLAALLDVYGFDVRTFASGADLLRGYKLGAADCIAIDQQMPAVTGLDVLKTLRLRGDVTPVILITGLPNSALHAKAKTLGGATVLRKPVSHAELMAQVHKMIPSRMR